MIKSITRYSLSLLLTLSSLFAHRVNVFTKVKGELVECQCFYNDGKPVIEQPVQVTLSDGTVITKGKTNDEGFFVFSPGVREDLTITLTAGMGHMATTTVHKNDLPFFKEKSVARGSPSVMTDEKNIQANEQQDNMTEKQIREIIEQVVDEKLDPVIDLIQKQQRSHSLTTIIGGIGYIVGIFGLFIFLKNRKKK